MKVSKQWQNGWPTPLRERILCVRMKKKVYRNRNASLLCQPNEFPLYRTPTEEGEVMQWHCVGEYEEWIGEAICVTDYYNKPHDRIKTYTVTPNVPQDKHSFW